MSRSAIDEILGTAGPDEKTTAAELLADTAEPDSYRPYIIRARAQVGFTVIEADGTRHGFQYHTLRHPKHQVREGEEFLSFTADGLAVVIQGQGLVVLHSALVRGTLAEVREYDRKPVGELVTKIVRLEVQDTQERTAPPTPRLGK